MDERAALTHSANRTFTDAQAADNLLSAVDGLLVTGNRSNVHPKNYGGTETPSTRLLTQTAMLSALNLLNCADAKHADPRHLSGVARIECRLWRVADSRIKWSEK